MYSIDIFCDVIDNYGDAGVCLHLAENLVGSGNRVRLFCNKMPVLEAIMKKSEYRDYEGFKCIPWSEFIADYRAPQIVINAFNCRLNKEVRKAVIKAGKNTVLINLEYLSAEKWVEDCHGLMSPVDGMSCFYFFPGFTDGTGGLNIDGEFRKKCLQLLCKKKVYAEDRCLSVSLFSYFNDSLSHILPELMQNRTGSRITVFEGLALDNLNRILPAELHSGDTLQRGHMSVFASPLLDHRDFDQVLLDSEVNLVRGEDSIVRAMHTGHPFLWQIYVQEENAHIDKLMSFLIMMKQTLSKVAGEGKISMSEALINERMDYITACMLAYNSAGEWPEGFSLHNYAAETADVFISFAECLCSRPSLADNLIKFAADKLNE